MKTMKTDSSNWIQETTDGILIRLKIQPGASATRVVGLHGDPPRLKIQVAAPPIDGAANKALVKFLVKSLNVSTYQVQIMRGFTSNFKDLLCNNVNINDIRRILLKI